MLRMTHRAVQPVTKHQVGPHLVELEPPDLIHIHYVGNIEIAHFLAFQTLMDALEVSNNLYVLRDSRQGGIVSQETRQFVALQMPELRVKAIATYGSSFQAKTVFSNMHRARRSISSNEVILGFFDTEEESRAWIQKLRVERDALLS